MATAAEAGLSDPDSDGDELVEMPDEPLDPSLEELFETDTLRWVFVGGKGGVGKTTTACSAAMQFAKRRAKVLILSTDPAHNLSDAFGQKFSNTPTLVKGFENLFAMELDSTVHETMQFSMQSENGGGWRQMIPEIVSALPGIDEALGFAELMQSVQSLDYSVIVFDTAPTGHTIRLLTFPDIIDKALRKLSVYRDKLSGTLNMLNMVAGQKINAEDFSNQFDSIKAITASVKETFHDPTLTTFVCVCIPEFLSVYETERLVQELARQNIDCSNIVVNQVLFPAATGIGVSAAEGRLKLQELSGGKSAPSGIVEPLAASEENSLPRQNTLLRSLAADLIEKLSHLEEAHSARRKMQVKYLQQICDLYASDFHVVCMPLQGEEVRGIERLQTFGELLLEERPLPLTE